LASKLKSDPEPDLDRRQNIASPQHWFERRFYAAVPVYATVKNSQSQPISVSFSCVVVRYRLDAEPDPDLALSFKHVRKT
jgi:hypothetical protein